MSVTERQLKEEGNTVTLRFLKGLILTRLNELDKARDLFIELTNEHPDLPEPYNNLAVIYASQGDFEKAQKALQQAIRTHPSYATAHENLGDIYAKRASKAYNQALQLDGDNSSAKAKLSLINDLFFVPKRESTAIETVSQTPVAAVVEPSPEPVIAAVTEPLPAPGTRPAEVKADSAVVLQQQAKKEIENINRDKEKNKAAVALTIDEWAQAWSGKNAQKYITFYGKDFTPPKKLSRVAGEAQRRVRLAKPKFINIKVGNMVVTMLGENHAQAVFIQGYQSDTYQDEVEKVMILKKIEDRWLITQEQSK